MRYLAILLLCGIASAQELLRPTVDVDGGINYKVGCIGQNIPSPTMALAHDAAGQATQSSLFGSPIAKDVGRPPNDTTVYYTGFAARLFKTWQITGNTYTSLTLNFNASSPAATGGGGNACLAYSTNSGSTWTVASCGASAHVSTSVTLSPSQNLSALEVSVCAQGNGGSNPGFDSISVYDIWTLGNSSASGNTGSGSSAGQGQRSALTVN